MTDQIIRSTMEKQSPNNNPQLIHLKKLLFIITTLTICILFLLITYDDIYPEFTAEIFYTKIEGMKQESDDNAMGMELQLSALVTEGDKFELLKRGISCNSDSNIDVCIATKQIRIDTQSHNVYIRPTISQESTSEVDNDILKMIRPYGTKNTSTAMNNVRPVQIIQLPNNNSSTSIILPHCEYTHTVPVIVFSTGGYSGNIFHSFNEIIIPLFLTSRHFRSQVQFLITDCRLSWFTKYKHLLQQLSSYKIVIAAATDKNTTTTTTGSVHCFPGGVVGLKYHEYLGLNSTRVPKGYTFDDFRRFLFESYDLKVDELLSSTNNNKPIVLLISRKKSRMWLNQDEIVCMMVGLGFEVEIVVPSDMGDLKNFSKLINSCQVMVGVHGAGFTNEVFLPKGAVVVQVVPIGVEWQSMSYYARPASRMGLKNLEYNVTYEESSLSESYSLDDPVISNTSSIYAKGYSVVSQIYLKSQNVRINVTRFRDTMSQAFRLL